MPACMQQLRLRLHCCRWQHLQLAAATAAKMATTMSRLLQQAVECACLCHDLEDNYTFLVAQIVAQRYRYIQIRHWITKNPLRPYAGIAKTNNKGRKYVPNKHWLPAQTAGMT
jgi:HD superfamily phosphohydrolase YqeK